MDLFTEITEDKDNFAKSLKLGVHKDTQSTEGQVSLKGKHLYLFIVY